MRSVPLFFFAAPGAVARRAAARHFFDSWLTAGSATGTASTYNDLPASSNPIGDKPPSLDPCVESRVQSKQLALLKSQEARIAAAYEGVLKECGSPTAFSPTCVAQLESEAARKSTDPLVWLANCDEKQSSGSSKPDTSGSMCLYAEKKVDRYAKYVAGFAEVADLMKQAAGNCQAAPLQCVKGLPLCLDSAVGDAVERNNGAPGIGITWCFKKCLSLGHYDFLMKNPDDLLLLEEGGGFAFDSAESRGSKNKIRLLNR
eukprot:g1938.t1